MQGEAPAPDGLSGRMADERAAAVWTARRRPWAAAVTRHPLAAALLFTAGAVLGLGLLTVTGHRPPPGTEAYGREADRLLKQPAVAGLPGALLAALG
jgi:hypothetical protein